MAEIPRLQESEPVLQPQGVVSGAEGFKEFAQTLGSLSEKAVKHVETIEEEKSDAMFTSSVADIEKLKTQAYVRMTEDPSSAKRVADDMKASLDAIEKNAFVNKADRNRLKKYTVSQLGEVERKAATTDVDLRLRMTAMHFYEDWANEQAAYLNANLTDHNQAEMLKDKMISKLNNMVAIGALTPHQGASLLHGLTATVQDASDLYTAANEETTPQVVNSLFSNSLFNNDPNVPHLLHPDTKFTMDHYRLNYDKNTAISQVMNGQYPNPQNWVNLNQHDRMEVSEAAHGYRTAMGMIKTADGGLATIEKAAKIMNEKGEHLSTRDRYTRDSLNSYISDIKNGNYDEALRKTGLGQKINENALMQQQAINNGAGSPLDKARMTMELNDRVANDKVAAGHAIGVPDKDIHPINPAHTAIAQNTFDNIGADPDALLNLQGQYSPANNGYFARSMRTPNQQLAMNVVYFGKDQLSPTQQRDYIYAQQGRNYKSEFPEQEDLSNKKLRTLIETELQPALRTINQTYSPSEAQIYRKALIDNAVNYARYIGGKNLASEDKSGIIIGGNETLKATFRWNNHNDSLSDYAKEAARVSSLAFEQKSNTNWVVNAKSLPPSVSDSDLDQLAHYVTREAYAHLKVGHSQVEFEEMTSRNPLSMHITSTHQVEARDGFGNVYWSMPYTSDMLHHAVEENRKYEEEQVNVKKARKEKGKEARANIPKGTLKTTVGQQIVSGALREAQE